MRSELKAVGLGEKHTFTAEFVKYSYKMSRAKVPIRTLLFQNIKNEEGKIVADHIWFMTTNEFDKFKFHYGNVVQFDAYIGEYVKGYFGTRKDRNHNHKKMALDYNLSCPSQIKKLCNTLKE